MHPMQLKLQQQIRQSSMRDPESDCWIWNRQISNSGFGKITVSSNGRNFTDSAHRVSYLAFVGPLERDDTVQQVCGNRLCVNPDHLMLAEQKQHGNAA